MENKEDSENNQFHYRLGDLFKRKETMFMILEREQIPVSYGINGLNNRYKLLSFRRKTVQWKREVELRAGYQFVRAEYEKTLDK